MKSAITAIIFLGMFSCSPSSGAQKAEESSTISVNLWVDSSNQEFDSNEAGQFFRGIFSKYSEDYYPLNSGVSFSESINSETGVYRAQSAFIIVDSLKEGNEKYLINITPEGVKKSSELIFYRGLYACHWELNPDGCEWLGFSSGSESDFIFNSDDGGYDTDFVKSLSRVEFQNNTEKEEFCSAILDVAINNYVNDFFSCEKIRTEYKWLGTELKVIHHYSKECDAFRDGIPENEIVFKHGLKFKFESGRISQLERVKWQAH